MSPPTDLHPAVADLPLLTLAAAAPLPDRWTVISIPTALSVHVVGMSLAEVEAQVPVPAESSGFRLDVHLPVVFLRDNFDIKNACHIGSDKGDQPKRHTL
jgi:hypothetical protein